MIVAKVLSVLLAAIVGVVGITLVTVFVCRKRKSKKAVLHHLSLSNPAYRGKITSTSLAQNNIAQYFINFFPFITTGGNFVTEEQHTSDSQLTAEGVRGVLTWVPSEYEEPVCSAPQYEMV